MEQVEGLPWLGIGQAISVPTGKTVLPQGCSMSIVSPAGQPEETLLSPPTIGHISRIRGIKLLPRDLGEDKNCAHCLPQFSCWSVMRMFLYLPSPPLKLFSVGLRLHLMLSILFQCGCHCEQQASNLVDNIKRRSTVCNLGPYLPHTILAFHQLDSTAKQWTLKQVKLDQVHLACRTQ